MNKKEAIRLAKDAGERLIDAQKELEDATQAVQRASQRMISAGATVQIRVKDLLKAMLKINEEGIG